MAESSADFGGGVSYSHTQVAQSSNFDRLSEGSGATEDGDAEVDYTMKVLRQLIFWERSCVLLSEIQYINPTVVSLCNTECGRH